MRFGPIRRSETNSGAVSFLARCCSLMAEAALGANFLSGNAPILNVRREIWKLAGVNSAFFIKITAIHTNTQATPSAIILLFLRSRGGKGRMSMTTTHPLANRFWNALRPVRQFHNRSGMDRTPERAAHSSSLALLEV